MRYVYRMVGFEIFRFFFLVLNCMNFVILLDGSSILVFDFVVS